MRKAVAFLLIAYVASYAIFRQSHIEVWERDKNAYVIFPSSVSPLYYAYRPLTYIDGLATGMRFHIGPHR